MRKRLLGFEAVDKSYTHSWYRLAEGNFLVLAEEQIIKLDTAGKEVFHSKLSDGVVMDIFETIAAREVSEGSSVDRVENGVVVGRSFKAGSADFQELGNDVEAYRAIHDLKDENIVEIRTMLKTSRALPPTRKKSRRLYMRKHQIF